MSSETFMMLFWVCIIGYVVWMAYMATFRTGDFLALMKHDHERKQAMLGTVGSVVKTGLWLVFKIVGK
jgi:hypothetical protein